MMMSQIWYSRNMQELLRDSDYGSKHKQDPSVIQAPFELSLRVLLVPIELSLQECDVFSWDCLIYSLLRLLAAFSPRY